MADQTTDETVELLTQDQLARSVALTQARQLLLGSRGPLVAAPGIGNQFSTHA